MSKRNRLRSRRRECRKLSRLYEKQPNYTNEVKFNNSMMKLWKLIK